MHRSGLFLVFVLSGVFFYSLLLQSQVNSLQSIGDRINIDSLRPFVMLKPTYAGQLTKDTISSKLTLKLLERKPSSGVFSEEWFYEFGTKTECFKVPTYLDNNSNLPANVPLKYRGHSLIKALSKREKIYIYEDGIFDGRYVLIMDSLMQKALYFLDFKAYYDAPQIKSGDEMFVSEGVRWASIQDSVLYVSNYHRTYSYSTFGKNAYLTAINLKTNQVIWRSLPLVCNSGNFLIYKDKIICGYGFTKELDYLYVVNRFSGKVEQKVPLKSSPDYFVLDGNILHLRTYDSEYKFQLN